MISGSIKRSPFQTYFQTVTPPGSRKGIVQLRRGGPSGQPMIPSYAAAKEFKEITGEEYTGETLAPTKDDLAKERFERLEREAIERERVAKEKLAATQTQVARRKRLMARRTAAQRRATLFQMTGERFRT
jgi:hypothetical protein